MSGRQGYIIGLVIAIWVAIVILGSKPSIWVAGICLVIICYFGILLNPPEDKQ